MEYCEIAIENVYKVQCVICYFRAFLADYPGVTWVPGPIILTINTILYFFVMLYNGL